MAGQTSAARGQEVRRRLRVAAAELIGERGWSAVSTRMVAERAGVAAGLVHYHYASVTALLGEAAIGAMRDVLDALAPLLERVTTADECVAVLVNAIEPYTGRDPASLLFVETYLAATRDEGLRAEIGSVLAEFRRLLADRLGRCGVPEPERTALVLGATVDGVLMHRALDPGVTAEAVTDVLRRMVVARDSGVGGGSEKGGGR